MTPGLRPGASVYHPFRVGRLGNDRRPRVFDPGLSSSTPPGWGRGLRLAPGSLGGGGTREGREGRTPQGVPEFSRGSTPGDPGSRAATRMCSHPGGVPDFRATRAGVREGGSPRRRSPRPTRCLSIHDAEALHSGSVSLPESRPRRGRSPVAWGRVRATPGMRPAKRHATLKGSQTGALRSRRTPHGRAPGSISMGASANLELPCATLPGSP